MRENHQLDSKFLNIGYHIEKEIFSFNYLTVRILFTKLKKFLYID
jgi:hypothetical protein